MDDKFVVKVEVHNERDEQVFALRTSVDRYEMVAHGAATPGIGSAADFLQKLRVKSNG